MRVFFQLLQPFISMVTANNNELRTTAQIQFSKQKTLDADVGYFSKTYIIKDHQLDGEFVAKEINANNFANADEYFEEARQMYKARHPNIVPVRYAGHEPHEGDEDDAGLIYIVMPLMPNGSLASLAKKRQLTVREIVTFGLQFLTGLAHTHRQGLVHFDVKPSNILLRKGNIAALTDFGLSKWQSSQGEATTNIIYGTHAPPEYHNRSSQTEVADIYQAGITLYRLCNLPTTWSSQIPSASTPELAQTKLRDKITSGNFPDRKRFLPHIPNRLRTVVKKATESDPNDRYQSVREMMNELASVEKYLDWKMERQGSDTDDEAWEWRNPEHRNHIGRTCRLEICGNGDEYSVKGSKKVTGDFRSNNVNSRGNLDSKEAAFKHVKRRIRRNEW